MAQNLLALLLLTALATSPACTCEGTEDPATAGEQPKANGDPSGNTTNEESGEKQRTPSGTTRETKQGGGNSPDGEKAVISPEASAFEKDMQAFGRSVFDALGTCRKDGLSHLQPGKFPEEGAVEAIKVGCADLLKIYPENREVLWGRSYSVDGLLGALARFDDELRIFKSTLDGGAPSEVVTNMAQHVLDGADGIVTHGTKVNELSQGRSPLDAIHPNTVSLERMTDEIQRYVENDTNDIGTLLERFDLYAYGQGTHPELVRSASLHHYGITNRRRLSHRKKWLEATLTSPPDASKAIRNQTMEYIVATDAYLAQYLTCVDQFKTGAIKSQEDADASRATLAAIEASWRGSQKQLLADLKTQ